MRINKIHIENFKGIIDELIEFNDINLIVGDPGQGKTSIIEALTFALTNELSDKVSEYVREGEKKFKIFVEITYQGNILEYTVEGFNSSTPTKRELIINKKETYVNSDATKYLRNIVDPKLILNSNISMQHKSSDLLKEKPSTRFQTLKKILKIDNFDSVISKIEEDREFIKDTINLKKGQLLELENKEFLYEELPDVSNINLDELNDEITNLSLQRDKYLEYKIKQENYLDEFKKYTEIRNNTNSYTKELNELSNIINNLNLKLSGISNIDFDYDMLNKLSSDKNDYENKINNMNSINKKISLKRGELNTLPSLKRTKNCQISNELLDKKNDHINLLKSDILSIKNKIKAVKDGSCYLCGARYNINDINIFTQELKDKEIDLKDSINEYDGFKKQIDNYNKIINENKLINQKKHIILEDINILEKELNEIGGVNFNYDIYSKLLEDKEIYENNKIEIDSLNEEINSNSLRLKELETYIRLNKMKEPVKPTVIDFDENNFHERKELLKKYTNDLNNYKIILERNLTVDKLKKDTELKVTTLEDELYKLTNENRILESTKNIIQKDFSAFLIENGTNVLKNEMNKFFNDSYGKYSIYLKKGKNSIDYKYSEDGSILRSVNTLSGYEECVFSLAQRVAMSSLHDIELFIADEIDSDNGSNSVLKLYDSLFNSDLTQFFIITHNSEVKEYISQLDNSKIIKVKEGKII